MDKLREAAQAALDWIEAQPHPRMLGAFDAAEQLRAALGEQEGERDRLLGIVADLAAWREFSSMDQYDLAGAAVLLMDEIAPDWRSDYEEDDDE